jgi:acyl dehydratase
VTSSVSYDQVEVGTEVPEQRFPIQRVNLIMYAGASGDFNPIHWNEPFAKAVGLPDVIAHGMLTMAEAARVVTDWTGDPAALVDYGVRFTRPVVVPAEQGAELVVGGTVTEKLPGNRVAVDLEARSGGDRVLAKARAIVQL